MIRSWQRCLVLLLVLTCVVFPTRSVQALPGTPGSAEFGNGAVLYPAGPNLDEAVLLAGDLELDWVSIPIDWSALQPVRQASPRLEEVAALIQAAGARGIAVMVSIRSAPAWALSTGGPGAEETAEFVYALAARGGQALRAVELFPGANTRQGWGAAANPEAYAQVFQAVAGRLRQENLALFLVAGGLQPQPEIPPAGNTADLAFLQALYDLGAADWMPILSLQYPELTGDPLLLPSAREGRVLRRYEDARRVMAENHHNSGMIWITLICLPSGTIDIQDSRYLDIDSQVNWLLQAFYLLRAQLYIGVAFLPGLNTEREGTAQATSLIREAGVYHPFYSSYRELTGSTQDETLVIKPGKRKGGSLVKKRPS